MKEGRRAKYRINTVQLAMCLRKLTNNPDSKKFGTVKSELFQKVCKMIKVQPSHKRRCQIRKCVQKPEFLRAFHNIVDVDDVVQPSDPIPDGIISSSEFLNEATDDEVLNQEVSESPELIDIKTEQPNGENSGSLNHHVNLDQNSSQNQPRIMVLLDLLDAVPQSCLPPGWSILSNADKKFGLYMVHVGEEIFRSIRITPDLKIETRVNGNPIPLVGIPSKFSGLQDVLTTIAVMNSLKKCPGLLLQDMECSNKLFQATSDYKRMRCRDCQAMLEKMPWKKIWENGN